MLNKMCFLYQILKCMIFFFPLFQCLSGGLNELKKMSSNLNSSQINSIRVPSLKTFHTILNYQINFFIVTNFFKIKENIKIR